MHQICKRIKKWRATVFSWDKLEEWGILHIMKGRRECVTINRSWTCNSYNIHYSMVSMRAENRSSEVAGHLSWIQRVCAIAGAQCWGGGRGSHFILQIRYQVNDMRFWNSKQKVVVSLLVVFLSSWVFTLNLCSLRCSYLKMCLQKPWRLKVVTSNQIFHLIFIWVYPA